MPKQAKLPVSSTPPSPSPVPAGEGEMIITFHPAEPMSSYQDAVLKCVGGEEADYIVTKAHGEYLLKTYPEHFTKKESEQKKEQEEEEDKEEE